MTFAVARNASALRVIRKTGMRIGYGICEVIFCVRDESFV